MALRRVMFDGDIVVLPLQSGELQIIEAHRIRTPAKAKDIIHGVKLDSFRKRIEYWITKDDIDPMARVPANEGFTHTRHETQTATGKSCISTTPSVARRRGA